MPNVIKEKTKITVGSVEYEVGPLIKGGSFGEAFRARQIKPIDREVVIKVPRPGIVTHPIWSKRFEREARVLSNIKHPNVVRVLQFIRFVDAGVVDNMALVQELVPDAKNLSEYLAANPTAAASAFLQTLYALRAFHDAVSPSIVHRDLSPNNILVGSNGLVKVIDFGISKEDPSSTGGPLTALGQWFGTAGVMSPEQLADSQSVDHRTDLFAVGRSFCAAIQARDPVHADAYALNDPWRSVCLKLTQHDRAQRYQSAEEAIEAALQAFAAAGIEISDFDLHIREQAGQALLPGWPETCYRYFATRPKLTLKELAEAGRITLDVYSHNSFDVEAFFEAWESSDAIKAFEDGAADFEQGDVLYDLYAKLYRSLSPERRVRCFERVAKHARSLHRYYMMDGVRTLYASETDDTVKTQMFSRLQAVDPTGVIESRGVLPDRPQT